MIRGAKLLNKNKTRKVLFAKKIKKIRKKFYIKFENWQRSGKPSKQGHPITGIMRLQYMCNTDVSCLYYGGLQSIIQVYRAKTVFLTLLARRVRFYLTAWILYQRGKNTRLKRLFYSSNKAALLFCSLCAFHSDASPSFGILFFSFLICVFFISLFFSFFSFFSSLYFSCFTTLVYYLPMPIYLIII